MTKCIECECYLVRVYKCPHECDDCADCEPLDQKKRNED